LLRRFLTGAIEEVSESTGVGRLFLGLIVLPIAGNAAEHITAVFVAAKDKMDLAIAVALGSSIQARWLGGCGDCQCWASAGFGLAPNAAVADDIAAAQTHHRCHLTGQRRGGGSSLA